MWKILNSVINKKKPTKNILSKHNCQILNDGKLTSERFILHQILVAKYPIRTSIRVHICPILDRATIYFNPIDQREITETMSQLKNSSPGHDNIDASIMKSVKNYFSYPLVHIFNRSFIHGIVPDQMKISKVIPIHKKVYYAYLLFSKS